MTGNDSDSGSSSSSCFYKCTSVGRWIVHVALV
jgi:hypothetical protein